MEENSHTLEEEAADMEEDAHMLEEDTHTHAWLAMRTGVATTWSKTRMGSTKTGSGIGPVHQRPGG